MKLLLDSNILTRLCHPAREANRPVTAWIEALLDSGAHDFCIPEIADYEVRRGLLHLAMRSGRSTTRSLRRLDLLADSLDFLPLSTPSLRRAAELWAQARHAGLPTAPSEALDADVILAAQALEVSGTVVTENLRHISRFAPASRWQELSVGI